MLRRRVPIARRNLFQERGRAALAFGGVGAALVLVLVLQGIFAGAMQQVTAYIRTSPADLIVSQRGVRTMHMSNSALIPQVVKEIRRIPGVAWAEGIHFTTLAIGSPSGRQLSYIIGYDPRTGRAGPHNLVEGRSPGRGEVVIDRLAARALSVGIGDRVTIFGRSLAVVGLSSGGTSIVTSTAFIASDEFDTARGRAIAYVMVATTKGTEPRALARRIEAALPVTAQTRSDFASQEARLVADMSADVLRIMTIIGLGIALAVISLLLYSVTLARLRDFGVLKALGASSMRVVAVVAVQVLWTVTVSVLVAVVVALGAGSVISRVAPTIEVAVRANDVARIAASAFVVAVIGAIVPLRRVLRVDPASAFRKVS